MAAREWWWIAGRRQLRAAASGQLRQYLLTTARRHAQHPAVAEARLEVGRVRVRLGRVRGGDADEYPLVVAATAVIQTQRLGLVAGVVFGIPVALLEPGADFLRETGPVGQTG